MSEAERITRALLGTWAGSYGTAKCPAHGDRRPSLSLADSPDGRLLAKCHAGCPFEDIIAALRSLGFVKASGPTTLPDPAKLIHRRAVMKAEVAKREAQAVALWRTAIPIRGTVAETYLRGRHVACTLPESLRFHPACWHQSARRLPAMVARVDGAARFSVHRTYLREDGSGKADVDPPKAMLGTVAGGAVRLVRANGRLIVAEGIETALSLASGLLRAEATIWATLSVSGLIRLDLPPDPGQLTIATDGDAAGRAGGQKLAERAAALGWTVSLLPAPEGRDWNDVLIVKGFGA